MSDELDDFLDSRLGELLAWGGGLCGSLLLARMAWRKVLASCWPIIGHVLGAAAWLAVMAAGAITIFLVLSPFQQRSQFRKASASALKALETSLDIENRELSDAQAKAKKRLSVVRAELQKLN